MKLLSIFFAALASANIQDLSIRAQGLNPAVEAIQFLNLGYTGYYFDVKKLEYDGSCKCEQESLVHKFNGTNAPYDEQLSVHFRGPLTLHGFAFYSGDDYVRGSSSSGSFSRVSYFNASEQQSHNLTFLTNAGDDSKCLGKALTYASSNGTGSSNSPSLLEKNNLIHSDDEYSIWSNTTCEKSGLDNDCGVYRKDIPALHGFAGATKLFLFEFEMPTEDRKNNSNIFYDMPAIWLLNAKIPRTSQYASNSDCSCWASGCGEYDIFEIMNSTESSHLYSTIHGYQGTGNINLGIQAPGHFERDLKNTMKGGVVFDSSGNAYSFLLNSTTLSDSIDAKELDQWINTEEEVTNPMASVTLTTSQKKSEGIVPKSSLMSLIVSLFSFVMYI